MRTVGLEFPAKPKPEKEKPEKNEGTKSKE